MSVPSIIVLVAIVALAIFAAWRSLRKGAPCSCGRTRDECTCCCGCGREDERGDKHA
ncbi:MAG: hypothetical protein IJ146_14600 [Kiritimatiellae bacterium]|nr:hypothetical protein [Kiritimatiellia bacterium]